MRPRLLLALILAVLVAIVVLQNTAPVETRFLMFSFTLPRALLLALTGIAGFALGVLVSYRIVRRK